MSIHSFYGIGANGQNPATLKADYGLRFHHFVDKKDGRLCGTICTLPIPETGDLYVTAVLVHNGDQRIATRTNGRREVFRKMINELTFDTATRMTRSTLASKIRDRTILRHFFPNAPVRRLRPPRPFVPPPFRKRMRYMLRKIRAKFLES